MSSECLVCWSVERSVLISTQGTLPSSGEGRGTNTHITSFSVDFGGDFVSLRQPMAPQSPT